MKLYDNGLAIGGTSVLTVFSKSNKTTKVIKPTSIKINNENVDKTNEVVSWGSDNLKPQKRLGLIKKNSAAIGGLRALHAAHFGSGLKLYTEGDDGDPIIVPFKSEPEIRSFFRKNKMNQVFSSKIMDLETHHIAFVEYVLSNDFNNIISLRHFPTSWVRMEPQKNGLIHHFYVNADWENEDQKYTETIKGIDPRWSLESIKEYCKQKKIHKFIRPLSYFMDEKYYYPEARWQTTFRNGWAEVVNGIPELKKAVAENQLHFKYLIYINEMYFSKAYKEWDDYSDNERKEIREKTHQAIDEELSGNKNGGKSLTSPKFVDEDGKSQVAGIEIHPIDNKLKDGSFLPDASAGNSETLFAMGVDPAILGIGIPGGKNLSGSGSDKRVAFNILQTTMTPYRIVSLDTFNFIRDYNNWNEDIEATYGDMALTTLDKNKTGVESTIN